ncbi:MAG: 5'/3'-nucleotidase SurE [Chloroflexi bacterium]|nr:5'/3'-nucleotidase SurE [Chloroflexota bacterium]
MSRSRSQKHGRDGTITQTKVSFGDVSWDGYGVEATPALAVIHAIYELTERSIELVASGINYGENVGSCVTVSGTIGAALEAAEKGIPTLAISQEIEGLDYHDFSSKVDFSAAIHFTRQVAGKILNNSMPYDADVLKLEVPLNATSETRCGVTRQDKLMYYQPAVEDREDLIDTQAKVTYLPKKGEYSEKDTDAYAMAMGWVSVTPLSFDLTSRGPLKELAEILDVSTIDEKG